ncbi:unnamed protein product (macronuclear) [Paramecium tetraurelia]|uniref:GPI ethanolamine phosphate transferase 1 n=1 Tax=Paramecium tetraurelia TaxID=5888 RepID=A0CC45_PARTE|nr:uncharacterized protein GSPATT00037146001 [Paramecium tetraurelia]CAK68362.1 unnamed protein product [Paramecium tetraurelia]|eukprot:XP_001435759.1 hypothetical protein (macronuclear) [Paramecium tetraurelia strain d4-2]
MLKSITRRRKKYIFLDYLIILFTALYLRIRSVDTGFYSSLQPNYLQLLTILFALMFANIGRVQCILISAILNIFSIYWLSTSTYIVLVSSIYKFTYDSLILLVFCHSLNVFRDKGIQVLTYCYAFGNYLEIVQIFFNLNYFKFLLFILIVSLSLLRQRCRQLPQSNYFIVIKYLCTTRIAIIQSIILLHVLLTVINLHTFVNVVTSSSVRYVVLLIYPLFLLAIDPKFRNISQIILALNVILSLLLLFDHQVIFFMASLLIPHIFVFQLALFIFIFSEINPKISKEHKYLNYDAMILIYYIILKNSYAHYDSYVQYKGIIYFMSIIIAIFIIIKSKRFQKSFAIKQNYQNNSYDQFESAKNDDTVF